MPLWCPLFSVGPLPSINVQGFSSNAINHALRIMSGRQEVQYLNEQRQLRRLK